MVGLSLCGCGSKTGLEVPEPPAVETDGGLCVRSRVTLEQRTPEILFVVDQSRSMENNLLGEPAEPGETRRWDILGDALVAALRDREDDLGFGVLMFPDAPDPISSIEQACRVNNALELPLGPADLAGLDRLFDNETPIGGTPTAAALRTARGFVEGAPEGVQRFVVLATDGAPNCNPEPPILPPACFCTSDDIDTCLDPEVGPFQCLDDTAAVDAVTALSTEDGVPVYVIGIDDPRRPEFAATLDAMALAGTRPRPEGGRRFYDVQAPADLDDALETITQSIEECVFYLTRGVDPLELETLEFEGQVLRRDTSQSEGWDITNEAAGELSLFGSTCAFVAGRAGTLTAFTGCR